MNVAPVRHALDFGPRPGPAGGIFETILVTDGAAPLLDVQLERLRTSARELYGVELAVRPTDTARAGAPDASARLRVTYRPGRGVHFEHGPRPPDPVYTRIAPFILPGGLGPHKWLDRSLLDALRAAAGEGGLPLLLDADGAVLEAAAMNVLIEERGRLVSPPSDGRFRAGFGRTRLRYVEERVDLDRLLAADAVVLTSTLRTLRLEASRLN